MPSQLYFTENKALMKKLILSTVTNDKVRLSGALEQPIQKIFGHSSKSKIKKAKCRGLEKKIEL